MDSDEGKLFVGGIAWDTTEERLSEYFGQYGEVTQTVIMRDKTTGRPRGFGFVVFSEPSVLDVVLNEKHTIDGRAVEAKRALSRDEQQQSSANKPGSFSSGGGRSFSSSSSSSGGGGNFKTKKIFVGGLPSTLSEDAFRHFFEAFGQVTDVVIMYDQTTQRPRGFGFITFDSEDAVDRVLLKNFHELNGKAVEVKRALPKDSNPSSSSSGGRGGYSGGNTAADGSRYIHQSQTAAGVGGGGGFPAYSGYGAPNYGYAPTGYGSYGVAGLGGSYGNPNPPNAAGFVPGAMKATWAPGGQSPAGYSASGYGNTVPWGGLSGGPTARGPSPSGASGYGYNNYGAYSGGYVGSGGRAPNSNVGPAGGDLMGTGGGYGDNNGGSGYLNSGWRSDPSQAGGGYYGGGPQSRQL